MAPYVTPETLLEALRGLACERHPAQWSTDPTAGPDEDTLAFHVAHELGFKWPVETIPGTYASSLHFLAEHQEGWFTLPAHDMWEEMIDLAQRGFEWHQITTKLEDAFYTHN